MKKQPYIILLFIIVVSSIFFMNTYKEKQLVLRHYISRNVSNDFRLLYHRIDDLRLLLNDTSADEDLKLFLDEFGRIEEDIYALNNSLVTYQELNENYKIDIYVLVDILDVLGGNIVQKGEVTEDHLALMRQLSELSEVYDLLRRDKTYRTNMPFYKLATLPEDVDAYMKALNDVRNEQLIKMPRN